MSYCAAPHARYVAGCELCRATARAYRAARPKPPPHDPIPLLPRANRTEADDAYNAGLMELLLQREIVVGQASEMCSDLLNEWANRRP